MGSQNGEVPISPITYEYFLLAPLLSIAALNLPSDRLTWTGSSKTPLQIGQIRSSSTSPWKRVTSYPMSHH